VDIGPACVRSGRRQVASRDRRRLVQGDVAVSRVAALVGMNRRSLNRRLAVAGTSIQALIGDVRFRIARPMLTGTRLSILEISAALGYADTSTFTRTFHRWVGVSLSAWQANQREAHTTKFSPQSP
jgi:AraC-like DNA-binding protein